MSTFMVVLYIIRTAEQGVVHWGRLENAHADTLVDCVTNLGKSHCHFQLFLLARLCIPPVAVKGATEVIS